MDNNASSWMFSHVDNNYSFLFCRLAVEGVAGSAQPHLGQEFSSSSCNNKTKVTFYNQLSCMNIEDSFFMSFNLLPKYNTNCA